MALGTVSNFTASIAHRNLTTANKGLGLAMARLSAGRRVLSARDDVAALAIGSRLQAEVSGLKQAQINAGQGASMLQVADGGMARINDILTRMKTLTVQAGSDQISATERSAINTESSPLASAWIVFCWLEAIIISNADDRAAPSAMTETTSNTIRLANNAAPLCRC